MKNCRNLPAHMKVDYIRLYQDATDPLHTLSCSPPSHPTAEFIAAHAGRLASTTVLASTKVNTTTT
jgi:hypothetical protein